MLFSTEHLAYGGILVAPDGMFIWAISLIIFPFLVNGVTYVKIYLLVSIQIQNKLSFCHLSEKKDQSQLRTLEESQTKHGSVLPDSSSRLSLFYQCDLLFEIEVSSCS